MKHYNYLKPQVLVKTLKTGRLKCLAQIPVMAGDRTGVRIAAHVKLADLKRSQIAEPTVEIAAFFVPDRHVYPNFKDFILQGYDETQTLASVTAANGITAGKHADWLGIGANRQCVGLPLNSLAGYNQIWNRFFRVPSDDSSAKGWGEIPDNGFQGNLNTDADTQDYGYRIAYPKTPWNTAITDDIEAADYELDVSQGKVDVRNLAKQRARYGDEQARNFFNQAERYTDILKVLYGTSVNTDADQRPTLLMHTEQYLGGYDINGTDQATLGQFGGRSEGRVLFGFPKRAFMEHGKIFILAWMRYQLYILEESNPLNVKANPDYVFAAGVPGMVAKEPPITMNASDWIGGSANPNVGIIPYGQHYRTLPQASIDIQFDELGGYPFFKNTEITGSWRDFHYVDSNLYDRIFVSPDQIGHAQVEGAMHVDTDSLIPPPLSGVFSGATR